MARSSKNSMFTVVNSPDRATSAAFASQTIDDTAQSGPRLVFFADGSAHEKQRVAGAGIAYKDFTGDTNQWRDFAYGVIGTNRSETAEFIAVNSALSLVREEMKKHKGSGKLPKVFVFTDSMVVLKTIRTLLRAKGGPCNMLWNLAYKTLAGHLARLYTREISVEFRWVKGHYGIEGNVRADQLAGLAMGWSLKQPRARQYGYGFKIVPTPQITLPEVWVPPKAGQKRKVEDAQMEEEELPEEDAQKPQEDGSPPRKKVKTE